MDDLKEAMLVAQVNNTASQLWQTEYYNKNLKDRDIEEGDYVLLANKGECGQCKLPNRWDLMLYVVVSVDPRCHTYQIKNIRTNQEKVDHRNLILQGNFLHIEKANSGQSHVDHKTDESVNDATVIESEDASDGNDGPEFII